MNYIHMVPISRLLDYYIFRTLKMEGKFIEIEGIETKVVPDKVYDDLKLEHKVSKIYDDKIPIKVKIEALESLLEHYKRIEKLEAFQ